MFKVFLSFLVKNLFFTVMVGGMCIFRCGNASAEAPPASSEESITASTNSYKQRILRGGWYLWDPYQYTENTLEGSLLTGLDIQLCRLILSEAGFDVEISKIDWKEHQEDLEKGEKDVGMGAFYSERRYKANYITDPYRWEENSMFVLKEESGKHSYNTVDQLLECIKKYRLRVGVTDGYLYANDALNKFIQDPKNSHYIVKASDDLGKLKLLQEKKIDGFLADRIAGATTIWRQQFSNKTLEKRLLDAKAPIHMLVSRKSVSYEEFQRINRAVNRVKKGQEYNQIVSGYLYPVIILETTSSPWFYVIELIGTIAFALSGLIVAYRINATLLGTIILAVLPSFGGGVIRDVLLGRFPIWILQANKYIITVLIIVFFGFFISRSSNLFKKIGILREGTNNGVTRDRNAFYRDIILVTTDAIGLAAFTVTGVLVCMIGKANPLWLWGPFFAFLTGAGGGMLRDIVVKGITGNSIAAINGEIYGEIALFWGGMLSCYLFLTVDDVDPTYIRFAVFSTVFLCFLTRLAVYWFKVPNLLILKPQAGDEKES